MPSAIETLIPHRPPMRFIDALTDCAQRAATATASLSASHFAVANGSVLESALIECAAQTVAAALGYRAGIGGQRSENNQLTRAGAEGKLPVTAITGQRQGAAAEGRGGGMLAAVSNFRIQSPPPAGASLQIEVREIRRWGPMLLVSALISCQGQLIASGELTLYA